MAAKEKLPDPFVVGETRSEPGNPPRRNEWGLVGDATPEDVSTADDEKGDG